MGIVSYRKYFLWLLLMYQYDLIVRSDSCRTWMRPKIIPLIRNDCILSWIKMITPLTGGWISVCTQGWTEILHQRTSRNQTKERQISWSYGEFVINCFRIKSIIHKILTLNSYHWPQVDILVVQHDSSKIIPIIHLVSTL